MTFLVHRAPGAPPPPVAVSGKGLHLWTAGGQEVIDASGGAAVSCLGHGDRRVIAAIAEQAERLAYVHSSFFTSEPAERLAEWFVGSGVGGFGAALFLSGGSEAVEAAIKLARQYFLERGEPGRSHMIARRQSYHGNTLGALALSGNLQRRQPYEPLLGHGFSHVSPAFALHGKRSGESDDAYVARLAAELDTEFQRVGPSRVAAFWAETVVGATTGAVAAPPGYFAAVRAVCDRYGALLILDEVMCGLGRTGSLHAWQQEGVVPDLQILAKGMAGGYQPIGAVLVSRSISDAIARGSGVLRHGHTYMAHPIACAAALAVQRAVEEDKLIGNAAVRGRALGERLAARFGGHAHVSDIRGRGLMWAIELAAVGESRTPFAPALRIADRIKRRAFELGLACYPGSGTIDGINGDHVLLAPPYIVRDSDLDEIVDRLGRAVDDVCLAAGSQC